MNHVYITMICSLTNYLNNMNHVYITMICSLTNYLNKSSREDLSVICSMFKKYSNQSVLVLWLLIIH